MCVAESGEDRVRILDQVQKVLTATLCVCVCVVSVTLLSVIFASQTNKHIDTPPTHLSPSLSHPASYCAVLLFYCFLRVIISTLTLFVFLSSAQGMVRLGRVSLLGL